ncbi:hypothetical protein MZM54_04330 [[Brevibacterium] frigoritolerans]|nr:hypothetical protein [Peribacillus frigoritolerans]
MDFMFSPQIFKFLIVSIVIIIIYSKVNNYIGIAARNLDEKNQKLFEKVAGSIVQYFAFFVYFLYVINIFYSATIISITAPLVILVTLLVFKKQVVSLALGYYRIASNKFAVDDQVILNNEDEGILTEVGLANVSYVSDKTKNIVTLSHNEIVSIEKIGEFVPVKTSVVISFRENPEKVEDVLIKLTERINEKFREYIKTDDEGNSIQPFEFKGIKNLNEDHHGICYEIEGFIHRVHKEEVERKMNRELAICCYKNNLRLSELNIFYKTKLDKQ